MSWKERWKAPAAAKAAPALAKTSGSRSRKRRANEELKRRAEVNAASPRNRSRWIPRRHPGAWLRGRTL